ncbi:ATP-grasp domain-containing protein, partial [Ruminococcaceae bacterium OttesenSCG-928-D13]|nr:ATP-grasp domain-containing protein [Ruminococcaceae bacterium OttesenSCG-928-D13]
IGTGAQAIHPGYGLLSENAAFVEQCAQCGITFIGPPARVISLMGDKERARATMEKARVPVVPGTGLVSGARAAYKEAKRIGTPLLVKARAGGGGRGIRRVDDLNELPTAFNAASAEAKAAFGDGGCYLEKLLQPVKHVEMQLICDEQGHVVCLGERECSVQRRNQKLLEESPSPAVTPKLRKAMMAAAEKAARAVGYCNAGTVEFLLDTEGKFYFMEMNTRLQVEHPVTEMVTGIDLVKWQIRVADGQPLSFTQEDVQLRGHAIECRINAEDPTRNFLPSAGRVTLLHIPGGQGVRFDTALYQDGFVPPYYDSLLGKLIVHAPSRGEAVRKMRAALGELVIQGVCHTADLQLDILEDPRFLQGDYNTHFMENLQC